MERDFLISRAAFFGEARSRRDGGVRTGVRGVLDRLGDMEDDDLNFGELGEVDRSSSLALLLGGDGRIEAYEMPLLLWLKPPLARPRNEPRNPGNGGRPRLGKSRENGACDDLRKRDERFGRSLLRCRLRLRDRLELLLRAPRLWCLASDGDLDERSRESSDRFRLLERLLFLALDDL